MRWLIPTGGNLPLQFAGVLTTPSHIGIPSSIRGGSAWAADNQAFTRGFLPSEFFPWLETMKPFANKCLFVACPDSVGDSTRTRILWEEWYPSLKDWPVAFVGQDGETDIPHEASALFVGGSTEWKLSRDAENLISIAVERQLHVHIGRVNYARRYRHFVLMPHSENFTCDGTRTRYCGVDKTFKSWTDIQNQKPLFRL